MTLCFYLSLFMCTNNSGKQKPLCIFYTTPETVDVCVDACFAFVGGGNSRNVLYSVSKYNGSSEYPSFLLKLRSNSFGELSLKTHPKHVSSTKTTRTKSVRPRYSVFKISRWMIWAM